MEGGTLEEQCPCGTGSQTTEHLPQSCTVYEPLRKAIWPDYTPVVRKLYGTQGATGEGLGVGVGGGFHLTNEEEEEKKKKKKKIYSQKRQEKWMLYLHLLNTVVLSCHSETTLHQLKNPIKLSSVPHFRKEGQQMLILLKSAISTRKSTTQ